MVGSEILLVTLLAVMAVVSLGVLVGAGGLLLHRRDTLSGTRAGIGQVFELLDRQWRLERWIYRHHRVCGLSIVAASVFCIGQLMHAEALLGQATPWPALFQALAIGQLANIAIGTVIFLRPSLLKPLEARANRWHDIDDGLDAPIAARRLAIILALAALLTLLAAGTLMLQNLELLTA